MKKLLILALVTLPLALAVGCGGDDDTTPPPTPPTDAQVLAAGWSAFTGLDYAEAAPITGLHLGGAPGEALSVAIQVQQQ